MVCLFYNYSLPASSWGMAAPWRTITSRSRLRGGQQVHGATVVLGFTSLVPALSLQWRLSAFPVVVFLSCLSGVSYVIWLCFVNNCCCAAVWMNYIMNK